jgi:glycosyltransferase involved in cell wall biosynthesis
MTQQSHVANEMPLVSLIMPAYNAEAFIGEAIDSVLRQTYPNWELVVINDSSTDRTVDIVQRYLDPRIRLVHAPHRLGRPSAVRNLGFEVTRGDFIANLDADDRFFPNSLEMLLLPFSWRPDILAVYGYPSRIEPTGEPSPDEPVACGYLGYIFEGYNPNLYPPDNWETRLKSFFYWSGLMIRREVLEIIGPADETLVGAEDLDFFFRLFFHDVYRIVRLNRPVYEYRKNDASLTRTLSKSRQLAEDELHVLKWIFAQPHFPRGALKYRSKALAYRYFLNARAHLLAGETKWTQRILAFAWDDADINKVDWARYLGQLALRTYLPANLDSQLRQLKRLLRPLRGANPELLGRSTPLA